jgi:pimeloyl-ACP methyl ester carboxylesterase
MDKQRNGNVTGSESPVCPNAPRHSGPTPLPQPQPVGPAGFSSPDSAAAEPRGLAATKRPIAFSAGSDPPGTPAWKTIPSWSLIGTADHVIPPAEELFMSKRADAHITKVNAGHLSPISNPCAVTRIILAAARATG